MKDNLTIGDKQYLKGHGISNSEFDKMDDVSRSEWKEECKLNAYGDSWNRSEAVGAFNSYSFSKRFTLSKIKKIKRYMSKLILKLISDKCSHSWNATTQGFVESECECEKCGKKYNKVYNKIYLLLKPIRNLCHI